MQKHLKPKPLSHLGDIPVQDFLNNYWQQKPVFIKNALPHWQAPLDGNELAGLALEESVESRLIIEKTCANPLKSQWQLEHGPLDETRFTSLPPSHFTLLVQALDQICPELNDLLQKFKFLPHWRLDDIMASVAPIGGSVGPHFDYYDVFLLQGTGSRRWQLGQTCNSQSPLLPNCPLKILTEFNHQGEYLAEPGDLLYIPANVAHWGVASSDDCTTYSIGFRAPSFSDILLDLSQDIASELSADMRYRDPANLQANLGAQITHAMVNQIAERCQSYFTPSKVASWLGSHLTEEKRSAPEVTTGEFKTETFVLAANCRAAYTHIHATEPNAAQACTARTSTAQSHLASKPENEQAWVFINGQQWLTSLTLARALCDYTAIEQNEYSAQDRAVITQWIDHGYLNLP